MSPTVMTPFQAANFYFDRACGRLGVWDKLIRPEFRPEVAIRDKVVSRIHLPERRVGVATELSHWLHCP